MSLTNSSLCLLAILFCFFLLGLSLSLSQPLALSSFYSVFLYLYRNHSLYLLSIRSFSISIATTRSISFLFSLSLSLSQPLALSSFYSVFLYLYRNHSLYLLSIWSFSISIANTRSIPPPFPPPLIRPSCPTIAILLL